MPRLYKLEPEVAGGWGPSTVVTNRPDLASGTARVPEVACLEYVFDGWMGDDLLAQFHIDHSPTPDIEIYVRPEDADQPEVLTEILDALGLSRGDLFWLRPTLE